MLRQAARRKRDPCAASTKAGSQRHVTAFLAMTPCCHCEKHRDVGGIDFVLTAHEGSAGFAADVTARKTGTPGLCIATLGPGATNLATSVGSNGPTVIEAIVDPAHYSETVYN